RGARAPPGRRRARYHDAALERNRRRARDRRDVPGHAGRAAHRARPGAPRDRGGERRGSGVRAQDPGRGGPGAGDRAGVARGVLRGRGRLPSRGGGLPCRGGAGPRPPDPPGAPGRAARGGPFSRPPVLLVANAFGTWLSQALANLVKARGYRVHFVLTGRELLDQAPTLRPDVIVLDADLPDLDSVAVCRTLRQNRAAW